MLSARKDIKLGRWYESELWARGLFNFFFRGKRERASERMSVYMSPLRCSTYLCIHWLLLVCSLIGDWTHNLGVSGQCSNQLSQGQRGYWNTSCDFKNILQISFPLFTYKSAGFSCAFTVLRAVQNLFIFVLAVSGKQKLF